MKKLLLSVCCALFAIFPALSDNYTTSFKSMLQDCDMHYNTDGNVLNVSEIKNQVFTISTDQNGGSRTPGWVQRNGGYFAFVENNTMTFRLNGVGKFSKIEITAKQASNAKGFTANTGSCSLDGITMVWTGDAEEVVLTSSGTNWFTDISIDYTVQLPISDPPVLNPPSGTYVGPLNVTISGPAGADIYYTIDGSAPTTKSAKYEGEEITFEARWNSAQKPDMVKAIAVEPGKDPSIIVSGNYVVLEGVLCPNVRAFTSRSFDMIPGKGDTSTLYQFTGEYTVIYQNGPIIYITDGDDGLRLAAQNAPQYQPGDVIGGFTGTFFCAGPFTPQVNVSAGSLTAPLRHTDFVWPVASSATDISRMNMSNPYELKDVYVDLYKAENSNVYRVARFEDNQEVLLYNAFENVSTFDHAVVLPQHPAYYTVRGFVGSDTGGGEDTSTSAGVVCFIPTAFIVSETPVATPPSISPNGGEYTNSVDVTILVPNGTEVYYTTDGSAPTNESTKYTAPFTLTSSAKVRAVAYAVGYRPSIIVEANFTVRSESGAPVFNPGSCEFYREITVSLSAPDYDAYIYYTLDGTDPDRMSSVYLSPIVIDKTTTIKAMAQSMDQLPSKIVTATYTLSDNVTQSAAPSFTPAPGEFTEPVTVTISAAEGAEIFYTLDGTEPTIDSSLYADPITISETTTVKAIAVENGKMDSSVVEATYVIKMDGINTISTDGLAADAVLYDLQGRRVNGRAAAGLYIMVSNGRAERVIVK